MTAPMSRSRRVAFGATLTFTMAGPPLIVIALSALGPLVVDDLDLTRAEFGSFAMVAFAVAAAFSAAGGRLVDRVGGRPATMVVCGGACASLLLVAAAPTYGLVLGAVALSGFLLALANPATNLLVSTHVPPGRRGALVGLKQSGVQLSQVVGGALLPGLAVLAGWRVAATVAAGLLAPTLLMSYFFVPGTSVRADAGPARIRRRVPVDVWWMTGYSFLLGCALQATVVYLPLFGHEDLGLSVSAAGLTAAVMGAVGLVARVAWGRLFERVRRPELLLAFLPVVATGAVGVL
ncbi:MFS transporter, partial [Blastococcus sp. CT_GayMR20]|uniref:MFS transporter n=1 Tax=Blastococcus sp. CT_GayMR20 TaxID=2559609 RepID=UPI001073A2B6